MKIVRIEAFPIEIPLRRPMRMAGRAITASKTVIVKLVTSDTLVGWGEANVATQLTGETADSIALALAALNDRLPGLDARDLRRMSEVMAQVVPAATSMRAAVDMALHDVVARSLGISVSRLLGGDESSTAPAIALIDPSEPDWLDECKLRYAEGARLIKLKTANAPVEDEVGFIRALAGALGAGASIAADSNGGWSLAEARLFCDRLADVGLMFLEQPLPPDRPAEAAELAAGSSIALGADEAIHHAHDIVRCKLEGLAGGVSLKLLKAGGLTPVRDAAALACGLGLSVNLSGKVGETSVANAATLHCASAMATLQWGVSLTAAYMADDVVAEPLGLTGSRAVLAGPGLGVAVDERKLVDLSVPLTAAANPAPVPAGRAHA